MFVYRLKPDFFGRLEESKGRALMRVQPDSGLPEFM